MTYPILIKPSKEDFSKEYYCIPDNIIPPPLFSPPLKKRLEEIVNESVEKKKSVKEYYNNK